MSFFEDDAWQREMRDKFLVPFYKRNCYEGRFVLADGDGQNASRLQKELHVDTIVQTTKDSLLCIDEKFVRWPGYEYDCYALETWSCTVPERRKRGWMFTSKVDRLFYVFVREHDAVAHYLPFKELQNWFIGAKNDYRVWRSKQKNRTECHLVPIADVEKAIGTIQKFTLKAREEVVAS